MPGGGKYPRNIAPLLRGGANLLGGESPVTPAFRCSGVTGDSPPQEICPPLKRGAIFLGDSPPFWIFDLKTKRLQVEKIYCVIYLFITRRQNYIHILGFLAAGGVHSLHNNSFEVLQRLVSYSTHLKWNHCPQRSHKIMLSYSSGSLHSHNIL
jgi:hypothetical protein